MIRNEKNRENERNLKSYQNLVDLNDFAKGIEEAFKDSDVTLPEDYIVDVSNHYEESYPQLKEYFDTHKHDVVLTGYDKEAVAVVNAAIDHGINVPEDMQVVGMMDTSYATICRPPLTTIHVPVYDMGAIAIRLLTKILNHEEIDEAEVPMHYTFIKRDTTK